MENPPYPKNVGILDFGNEIVSYVVDAFFFKFALGGGVIGRCFYIMNSHV